MFAKAGHHLLPPERIEEWRRRGALPFFHYGYGEERPLEFAFYEDSLRYDPFTASLIQPALVFQGLRDASVDYRTVEQFARARPNVTLSLLDDDHQLAASLPRIWSDVEAFADLLWRPRDRSGARGTESTLQQSHGDSGKIGSSFAVPRCLCGPVLCASAIMLGVSAGAVAQMRTTTIRIGFARPGGGYMVETMPLETYVARVLAGEAAARQPAGRAGGARDHPADLRRSEPRASPRGRIRSVRSDALPGRSRRDAGDRARRAGDRRTGAAPRRCTSLCVLQRLVRRTHGDPLQCVARRRGSPVLPSQPDDACGGTPAWTADLDAADLLRALHEAGFRGDRLERMEIAGHNRPAGSRG